jgi:hypothetical protein
MEGTFTPTRLTFRFLSVETRTKARTRGGTDYYKAQFLGMPQRDQDMRDAQLAIVRVPRCCGDEKQDKMHRH